MIQPADIKALRKRLKETQKAFAVRFGVDHTTIHRWETVGLPEGGAAKKLVERFMRDFLGDLPPQPIEATTDLAKQA